VIVLDALDECKDNRTTSIILSSLSRHVDALLPLKILVTSRPEPNITTVFKWTELGLVTERLILHEVELSVVQNDINLFLTMNFRKIGLFYGLDNAWPAVEDINALASLSFGLFIFAATSLKFIQDQNYSDPRYQLAELLRNTTLTEASYPYHHLNQLYTQVLTKAFPNISSHLVGRLKMVLGTITLLQDPLPLLALEQLLNLKSGTVQETLLRLHSVIIVPDEEDRVIRLLHPSFFDFITNPTRCLNQNFVVNAVKQHTLLAHACLETMCGLKRDICEIKNHSILNHELDDLPARIAKHIPTHLQYAWSQAAGMVSQRSMHDGSWLTLAHQVCSNR